MTEARIPHAESPAEQLFTAGLERILDGLGVLFGQS